MVRDQREMESKTLMLFLSGFLDKDHSENVALLYIVDNLRKWMLILLNELRKAF